MRKSLRHWVTWCIGWVLQCVMYGAQRGGLMSRAAELKAAGTYHTRMCVETCKHVYQQTDILHHQRIYYTTDLLA